MRCLVWERQERHSKLQLDKSGDKRPLRRPALRWKVIINTDRTDIRYEDVVWIPVG
jgi:hypothetical protein